MYALSGMTETLLCKSNCLPHSFIILFLIHIWKSKRVDNNAASIIMTVPKFFLILHVISELSKNSYFF